MNFKVSSKPVKHLLNGTEVVVLSGKFVFNTVVEWQLADFSDEVPPYLEVLFVDRCTEETILCVSNLDHELGDVLLVVDKNET